MNLKRMKTEKDTKSNVKIPDTCIVFVPYGSRLGFHENGIASTMANIDYKFPQCVCHEKEPLCLNFQGSKGNNIVSDDGKSFSLNAMHGHDVHVVCFKERCGCEGGGKGIIASQDISFSIPSFPEVKVCYGAEETYEKTIICLNDQGGGVMSVTENFTATLRAQEHGHPPIVCMEMKDE